MSDPDRASGDEALLTLARYVTSEGRSPSMAEGFKLARGVLNLAAQLRQREQELATMTQRYQSAKETHESFGVRVQHAIETAAACQRAGDEPGRMMACGVQQAYHQAHIELAAVLRLEEQAPTAGDLLIRAVDKWASHAMGCDLDECEPCTTAINQLRLAYKVWQQSAYQQESTS